MLLLPLLISALPTFSLVAASPVHPEPPATSTALATPKILLLRHGEKPLNLGVGLNCVGKKRAQCLRKILGPDSAHNLGLVVSQSYNKKTGHRKRSYSTVEPLAEDWGLKVDHECYKMDPECAARKVREYVEAGGTGEVVIAWKGMMIGAIASALGVQDVPHYPMNRYDTIWTIINSTLVSQEPEECPGIPDFPPGGPPHRRPGPPPGGPPGKGGERPPHWPGRDGRTVKEGMRRLEEEVEEVREEETRWEEMRVEEGSDEMQEEEGEEECDLDEYLDSHDWSRWTKPAEDVEEEKKIDWHSMMMMNSADEAGKVRELAAAFDEARRMEEKGRRSWESWTQSDSNLPVGHEVAPLEDNQMRHLSLPRQQKNEVDLVFFPSSPSSQTSSKTVIYDYDEPGDARSHPNYGEMDHLTHSPWHNAMMHVDGELDSDGAYHAQPHWTWVDDE
ncbi:hypothetical protein JCM8547_002199 [Rhodosporidiobolus lusitaniae]